jgi:hypothetical protein
VPLAEHLVQPGTVAAWEGIMANSTAPVSGSGVTPLVDFCAMRAKIIATARQVAEVEESVAAIFAQRAELAPERAASLWAKSESAREQAERWWQWAEDHSMPGRAYHAPGSD